MAGKLPAGTATKTKMGRLRELLVDFGAGVGRHKACPYGRSGIWVLANRWPDEERVVGGKG